MSNTALSVTNGLDAAPAGQRQAGKLFELAVTMLINVLQGSDYARHAVAQVHRSADAGPPAARAFRGPVREIAFLVNFEPTEDRSGDVASAHRTQRRSMMAALGLTVIGSLLALVILLSASHVLGFGPKPKQPFSVWKITLIPAGR